MSQYCTRSFALFLCAALAATATARGSETFPVVHHEPITLRVLDGKNGRPVAHVRLQLVGGYNARDLAIELWYAEAVTDAAGEARLPDDMANLPFLRVGAAKEKLCLSGARRGSLSVERIRGAGFSMSNQCGVVSVPDAPGVLTIYVKGGGAAIGAATTTAAADPAPAGDGGASAVAIPGARGELPDAHATGRSPDVTLEPTPGTAEEWAAYLDMCHPDR